MKWTGYVIIGATVVVAGAVAFWLAKGSAVTKLQMINFLQTNQYSDVTTATMQTFGNDYITAWYNAASAVPFQPTFVLAGKTYDTSGGGAM